MSRSGSGTYSLPAGNPVVTATPITIAWANGTLNDIATALTDSLSRSGSGGMTAALRGINGVVGAPAFSFTSEPSTGFFRNAAGDVRLSLTGAEIMRWESTGVTITGGLGFTGALTVGLGTALLPSYTFTGDVNTGIYSPGADQIGFTTNGTLRVSVNAAGNLVATQSTLGALGAVGTPGYAFSGDPDTGIWSSGANVIDFATSGANRLSLSTTQFTSTLPLRVAASGATTPMYSIVGDTGTGVYSPSANVVGFSVNAGAQTAALTTTAFSVSAPTLLQNGTAANPSYSFTNDPDTGLYSMSANVLGFSEGATTYRVGYREIPRQTTGGTLTAAMVGTCQAVAASVTVNNSVFAAGDSLMIYNNSASTISITKGTITNLRLAGTATDATQTLAVRGFASLWFNSATECVVSGNVS